MNTIKIISSIVIAACFVFVTQRHEHKKIKQQQRDSLHIVKFK